MITIEKLFENVSYTSSADISKIKIKGIATDSRQVKDGDLFVCIRGKDDDGHKHALEAQMLGAVAILAEHATETSDSDCYKFKAELQQNMPKFL